MQLCHSGLVVVCIYVCVDVCLCGCVCACMHVCTIVCSVCVRVCVLVVCGYPVRHEILEAETGSGTCTRLIDCSTCKILLASTTTQKRTHTLTYTHTWQN